MIVSKDIKKRFVRAAIIVGAMVLLIAGSVGIYRMVYMMNSVRKIRKELIDNNYIIGYVKSVDNQSLKGIAQCKLNFEKKHLFISNDEFKICAEYKLNNDYQIEITSIDTLSSIMCGLYEYSAYKDGLHMENKYLTISAFIDKGNAGTDSNELEE